MQFYPLEANPDTFNPLASSLGLNLSQHTFIDILSLDDQLLSLIPQPVAAIIMLAPSIDGNRIPHEGESLEKGDREGLVWIRQRFSNQCGTIALLHALANSTSIHLSHEPLNTLFQKCRNGRIGPDETADLLAATVTEMNDLHRTASQTGQSHLPELGVEPNNHYVAFVEHRGQVFELDGACRPTPVYHGLVKGGSLLHTVAEIVRQLMVHEEGKINFNLMALAPTVQ